MTATADAGVIGMAVMGRNLAKNIESRGYTVAIYNRSWEKTQEVLEWEHGKNARFVASKELADFVASIKRPRRIIIMVKPLRGRKMTSHWPTASSPNARVGPSETPTTSCVLKYARIDTASPDGRVALRTPSLMTRIVSAGSPFFTTTSPR